MRGKSRRTVEDRYVLDAYSLLAFLEGERGGEKVKGLLERTGTRLYMSVVNLGEVYYILLRERGRDAAELMLSDFRQAAQVSLVGVTWERARAAAELKARGGISYADCFAAALAAEKGALLVTGDREFEGVADTVKIMWIHGTADDRGGAAGG